MIRRLCASFEEICATRAGRRGSSRLALKPRITRDLRWRKDTRHFPIRESGRFPLESCQRRILSCVLPDPKPAISRGNWTTCDEKCQIARTLRLYGGPGRDRTDDLFHAMEARSQLRHRPTGGTILFSWSWNNSSTNRERRLRHFGAPTSAASDRAGNRMPR